MERFEIPATLVVSTDACGGLNLSITLGGDVESRLLQLLQNAGTHSVTYTRPAEFPVNTFTVRTYRDFLVDTCGLSSARASTMASAAIHEWWKKLYKDGGRALVPYCNDCWREGSGCICNSNLSKRWVFSIEQMIACEPIIGTPTSRFGPVTRDRLLLFIESLKLNRAQP